MAETSSAFASEPDSWRDEDEMFLDQDDPKSFASDTQSIATFVPSNSLSNKANRSKSSNLNYAHIVYKSKPHTHERHSDFAELESSQVPLEEQLRSQFNLTSIHLHQDVIGAHPYSSTANGVHLNGTNQSSAHRRTKRQAPDTVWPEVLLVVDYDSYLLHGANSRDVKRYFISFWNGVDLRYKLLTQPTIRISLAGMIVAKVLF